MSMVKSVLDELKMEVRSDMRAASMTEIMMPLRPSGMMPITRRGKAILEQLAGF